MTVAHTPGPWEFVPTGGDMPLLHVYCSDGKNPSHHTRSAVEQVANARLIAAAPKLLEALVAVHAPYATLTDEALDVGILMEFGPPKPEKGAALLLARAAIAKATGDTPA